MKSPITRSAVATRDGYQLAPRQPSLRLAVLAFGQYIRRHAELPAWLNSRPPFTSPINEWRAHA